MKVITDGTATGTCVTLDDGTELPGVKWVQIFVTDDPELNDITICFESGQIEYRKKDE